MFSAPILPKRGISAGFRWAGTCATLPKAERQPPRSALRDVDGANLDRVQIIKRWLDSDGELHEQVYDVMCSDDRTINSEHRCEEDVGNTVDIEAATYTNSIGAALMMAYWKDPAFDPEQRAFYYVRVLEVPTPRWTTYDAAFFGIARPEGVPPTQQERAYKSPIWYTPAT